MVYCKSVRIYQGFSIFSEVLLFSMNTYFYYTDGKKRRPADIKTTLPLYNRKRILYPIFFAVLTTLSWTIILKLSPKPPYKTISECQIMLRRARQLDAEYYAPELFKSSVIAWEKMMEEWRSENKKWTLKRNFHVLEALAKKTSQLTSQACERAVQLRDSTIYATRLEISLLQREIEKSKTQLERLPVKKSLNQRIEKSELLLLESKEAFKRHDYLRAMNILKETRRIIGQAAKDAATIRKTYWQDLPKWHQWAEETIAWSKNYNEEAILVDKMNHVCMIYKEGNLFAQYDAEFGPNWIGAKICRGDGATPEGHYFIRKKKETEQTKYHKALEIDYPNEQDQERFLHEKNRKKLKSNAKLGEGIEIHGEGGRGMDWTQGCIALKNEDMDQVFQMVKEGTPVTIVGSLSGIKDFESVKKRTIKK